MRGPAGGWECLRGQGEKGRGAGVEGCTDLAFAKPSPACWVEAVRPSKSYHCLRAWASGVLGLIWMSLRCPADTDTPGGCITQSCMGNTYLLCIGITYLLYDMDTHMDASHNCSWAQQHPYGTVRILPCTQCML